MIGFTLMLNLAQPLAPLGGKRKGKQEIKISTAEIDERQHSPGYYKQTDLSKAFRKVRSSILQI